MSSSRGPIAWMTCHPVAANLLMAFLMIGGLLFGRRIQQEVFPEFDLDMIVVHVSYPGASPAETEQGIVLAVEEAVRSLDGVKEVTATASEGIGVVTIELETGTDSIKALQDVKSEVDAITTFPEESESPIVALAGRQREVLTVMVHGDVAEETLRQVAERVRMGILDQPGITYVELEGAKQREITINLPEASRRAYGLSLNSLAARLSKLAVELPGGGVKTAQGEVLVRVADRRDRAEDFAKLPAVAGERPLADIADVVDGYTETDLEFTFNGEPALMVNVYRTGDQTPTQVSDETRAYVEAAKSTLPPGVSLTPIDDSSELLESRMDLLMRNAYMGLALVLAVLGLFLNFRLAFWVTMGIPISFLGSLIVLPLMGVSINMVSLFAFIVTLGVVVDDAIVVGENIFDERQKGTGWVEAATTGAQRIATPVVFSVLTTIAAFSPLYFVPGTMGQFFSAIPAVVIAVLSISLIESIFVLPAHLSHRGSGVGRFLVRLFGGIFSRRLRAEPLNAPEIERPPSKLALILDKPRAWFSGGLERVNAGIFSKSVRFALERRYLTLACGLALLIATAAYVAAGHIRFSPRPNISGDRIAATATLPYGVAVEETEKVQKRMIAAAQEVIAESGGDSILEGLVSAVGRAFGGGPGSATGAGASNIASVQMYLVPSDERAATTREISRKWREKLSGLMGLESLSFKSTVGPSGTAVSVRLAHEDIATLEAAAAKLAEEIGHYAGTKDIDDGVTLGKPQIDFKVNDAGEALGLTSSEIGAQVRGAFYGAEVLRQQRGRDEVKVMVRRPRSERSSEFDWESLLIRTPGGAEVPLVEVADVKRGRAYTSISRAQGRRVLTVTADVDVEQGNDEEILAGLAAKELPALMEEYPGLTYSFEGAKKSTDESTGALKTGGIVALLMIFILLAIPFGSYLQPLVVMSAIPFGLVGAVGGHLLLGYDMSMLSLFGMLAVSGIVVNDSLVLVDAANERRDQGAPPLEAVHSAARRRLRPILLTSLTTFFGLAPMILETSVQAKFLIPMAISLGFGVMFATLITLVLVPALYLIVEDARAAVMGPRKLPKEQGGEAALTESGARST